MYLWDHWDQTDASDYDRVPVTMTKSAIVRDVCTCHRVLGVVAISILLILSALIYVSAIATHTFTPLLWICLIPLFRMVKDVELPGAVAGAVLWGMCVAVFRGMLADGAAFSFSAEFFRFCLLPVIFVWGLVWFRRYYGFNPLAVALGWMALEYVWIQAGVNNTVFSSVHGPDSFLDLVANFLGYGFVGFAVAYVNASLVSLTVDMYVAGFRSPVPKIDVTSFRPAIINIMPAFSSDYWISLQPRAPPLPVGEER
jgi:hypothetical protein